MDLDNKKDTGSSEAGHSCVCGCSDHSENECCSGHEHDECGCGGHDHGECGCGGHDHGECGCGCGHEHETQYLTLLLEDGSELKCQVLGLFENNGNTYISLLHPTEETVFLFRCYTRENNTIDIEEIEDNLEYEEVSKLFLSFYNS
jgi:hypothetical protein